MSTATLKNTGLDARSPFPGAGLMESLRKGAARAVQRMIAARERQAMIIVRRYAELYQVDLDVVQAEMARTLGSDEDTPRNQPRASRKEADRVTRF